MSTKSSPRAPPVRRSSSPNRRERAPDHRAAGAPAAPQFRPIHTRRAFEEICERIREQLALGVLKPGDKLPPERDLAQQLGVSRNVLREALRSLEMAGVLRLQKGVKGGAFIQEGDTSRMNGVMRDMPESRHDLGPGTVGSARSRSRSRGAAGLCQRAKADLDALEANIRAHRGCDAGRAAAGPRRMLARILQAARCRRPETR